MPRLSKRALRDLEGLPEALQTKARNLLSQIDADPAAGKKLLGKLAGLRSLRLGRTHRIIYMDSDENLVLTISNRKDAYK